MAFCEQSNAFKSTGNLIFVEILLVNECKQTKLQNLYTAKPVTEILTDINVINITKYSTGRRQLSKNSFNMDPLV